MEKEVLTLRRHIFLIQTSILYKGITYNTSFKNGENNFILDSRSSSNFKGVKTIKLKNNKAKKNELLYANF